MMIERVQPKLVGAKDSTSRLRADASPCELLYRIGRLPDFGDLARFPVFIPLGCRARFLISMILETGLEHRCITSPRTPFREPASPPSSSPPPPSPRTNPTPPRAPRSPC